MLRSVITGIALTVSSITSVYAQQDDFFARPEKLRIEATYNQPQENLTTKVFLRAAKAECERENYIGAYRQYKNAHGTVPPTLCKELADKVVEAYHLDAVHAHQLRWVVQRYKEAYNNTMPSEKKSALATILAVSNLWFDPDEENCTQTTSFGVNEKLNRIGIEELTEDETRVVIRNAVKLYDKGKPNYAGGGPQYRSPADVVTHLRGRKLSLKEGLDSFVIDIFFQLGKPVHDILSSFSHKKQEWPNEWIKHRYTSIVADLLETPHYNDIKRVCEITNHQVPLMALEEYAYKLWNAEYCKTATTVLSDIKTRDREYIFRGALKSVLISSLSNHRAPLREIIQANAAVGLSLKDHPYYQKKLLERAMQSIHHCTISNAILAAQAEFFSGILVDEPKLDQSTYTVKNAVKQMSPWLDEATTVSAYLKDQRIPIAREIFNQVCSLGKEEPPLGTWTFERVASQAKEIVEMIADSYINAGDKEGCITCGLFFLERGNVDLSLPFFERVGYEKAPHIVQLRLLQQKSVEIMQMIFEYLH